MPWPGAACDRPVQGGVQGSGEAGKSEGSGIENFGISRRPTFPSPDVRCLHKDTDIGSMILYPSVSLDNSRKETRLFYGCSYRFHLSGDNSRDRYVKGS